MKGIAKKIKTIPKFVLTGGPCSGKTSSIAHLVERLSDYGFTVFVVPETATIITNCGIDRRRMKMSSQIVKYEEAILDLQLFLEERVERSVYEVFSKCSPVVLLDRGIMDIKAFMPEGYEEEFEKMLERRNLNQHSVKSRYTGVIHLVTCADGKREYYTLEGNSARIESPDVACMLDRKIRQAWLGHPNMCIIGNEEDFQEKIRRTFISISKMLGIPVVKGMTRKYIVESVDFRSFPEHEKIEIEEHYLQKRTSNEEIMLKRRGQRDAQLYFVVRRSLAEDGTLLRETERMISEEEYLRLFRMRDKRTVPVRKIRYCFFWENQYLKLDLYLKPLPNLKVLSLDLTEESECVKIPDFLKIEEEITFNAMYRERNIALKKPHLF